MSDGLWVLGELYIEDIHVSQYALRKFFSDEERVKELLEYHMEGLKKWIENEEAFVREVLEEEKKYGLDPDKYPPELAQKAEEAEELYGEILEAKVEIGKITAILEGRS